MTEPETFGVGAESESEKRDGRSRGRSAAGRTASARTLPRGQYVGRDGEVLTRNVSADNKDQFELPPALKEPGWDYQWLSEHILNSPDIVRRHNHQMYQAGWRPVMATGRWNGVFGPKSDTGHVRVGDSGLYERPLGMSEDARDEEYKKAYQQLRDRDEALTGRKANLRGSVGGGLELQQNTNYKGRKTQMSIGDAYDIPRPSHDLAEPGE